MKQVFLSVLTIAFFAGFFLSQNAHADEQKIPRMASIRSNNINGRTGPGARYPIEWIYAQRNAPLEIVAEFELWRKVKDWENSESWVHTAMLSPKRTVKVITPGENNIYAKSDYDSKILAKVEDGVVGDVKKCESSSNFCLIKFSSIEGYIAKTNLFGIYKNEEIN